MDEALAKSPANRIASIGELVDRIGHVYGLEGTYADWAALPEAELREQLRIALIARVAPELEPEKVEDYSALDAAFEAEFAAQAPSVEAPPSKAPESVSANVQPPALPTTSRPWLVPVMLLVMFVLGMVIASAIRR
jgi:hypothetical protein